MEVIFSHEVIDSKHRTHWLEICVGDATESHAPSEVDVLAISCFENSYAPTRGTMVKSLIDRGVNVAELSKRKAIDERARWQCWLSESLVQESPIGRILCFEHGNHRDPQSVVGNVFRMVSEFALGSGGINLKLLRLPLLSTGNQGADKSLMLESIIRQAYNHLRGSLPVAKVQIVLNEKSQDIHRLVFESGLYFHQIRSEWHAVQMAEVPTFDYFISYRHTDISFAESILDIMYARKPNLRIFLDRNSLGSGVFWKPELITGIHNSSKAICLITDSYPDSEECIDEFHAAMCCGLSRQRFLIPLLNLSERHVDTLPQTFKRVNLIDATCPPHTVEKVVDKIFADDSSQVH
jgi:hypothetical protein